MRMVRSSEGIEGMAVDVRASACCCALPLSFLCSCARRVMRFVSCFLASMTACMARWLMPRCSHQRLPVSGFGDVGLGDGEEGEMVALVAVEARAEGEDGVGRAVGFGVGGSGAGLVGFGGVVDVEKDVLDGEGRDDVDDFCGAGVLGQGGGEGGCERGGRAGGGGTSRGPRGVMEPVVGERAESWRRCMIARSRARRGGIVRSGNVPRFSMPWDFSVRTSCDKSQRRISGSVSAARV